MIAYQMTLDYTLAPGWMAPFSEGLLNGQAMGRACPDCPYVSFPPSRICTCGSAEGIWCQLPGTANILLRTNGSDGAFALVQFDGATTNSVVRLQDIDADATRGRLAASTTNLPQMILCGIPEETTQ